MVTCSYSQRRLSAPLDQPADGFEAARRAILLLNPSIESGQFYRHADLNGSSANRRSATPRALESIM
jgi:hypothetical protein